MVHFSICECRCFVIEDASWIIIIDCALMKVFRCPFEPWLLILVPSKLFYLRQNNSVFIALIFNYLTGFPSKLRQNYFPGSHCNRIY
jgi:hypothetical protein